jgi:hypothetical protein
MLTLSGLISGCGLGCFGAAGDDAGAGAPWSGLTAAAGKTGMLTLSGFAADSGRGWLGATGEDAGVFVAGTALAGLPAIPGAGALVPLASARCSACCSI